MSSQLRITFPEVGPKIANQFAEELANELAAVDLEGSTAEVKKFDHSTQDLGSTVVLFGQFWESFGAHTAGHVMGAAALGGLALLMERTAKWWSKKSLPGAPAVTVVEVSPEAAQAVEGEKKKHGFS